MQVTHTVSSFLMPIPLSLFAEPVLGLSSAGDSGYSVIGVTSKFSEILAARPLMFPSNG